jgi:hypothetical protein
MTFAIDTGALQRRLSHWSVLLTQRLTPNHMTYSICMHGIFPNAN